MPRKIIQHHFNTPETLAQFNPENIKLADAYLRYLSTSDRSPSTIRAYHDDLNVIWYWNLMYNDNRYFLEWTKADIIAFQSWSLDDCQHSANRVRHLKAVIASLSNFIEDILDTEHPGFKKISHRIPNPTLVPRMEKSVFHMKDINVLLGQLTFQGQYDRACCLALAVCSGRRKSELLRFKLSDFTEERLVCNGALYKSAPLRTKGHGREGKKIECYVLHQQFKPYLDRWLSYRERHGIESEWLFPTAADPAKSIDYRVLNDWATAFCKHTPLPFYWHAMRHLTATNFVRAGVPDSVIVEYFGWSTSQMLGIYNDLSKEETFAMYFNPDGTYGGAPTNISDVKFGKE